jgi:DNA replication protein DnaC
MKNISVDKKIKELLKEFKLPDISHSYEEEIEKSLENNISYREFLYNLLKIEEDGKFNRLKEKNLKAAKFENFKTIDDFNFDYPETNILSKIKNLEDLSFVDKGENVVFIGPPGVGKSHLSTALGIKACEKGKKVLFINANDLMDELFVDISMGRLKQKFKKLAKIDLLIIDEMGYLKMDKERESIFFQLVRQRYEKKSLIITTNLPFNKWDQIFSSTAAATAVLDRLLHHCHVISIAGDSFRVKNKLKEGH